MEVTEKSTETDTTTWSELPRGAKNSTEQSPGSEVRNRSNRPGLRVSESGMRVGKSTIWVRSWVIAKLKEYSPGWSDSRECFIYSILCTLKSPKTNTLAERMFWQSLIYIGRNSI